MFSFFGDSWRFRAIVVFFGKIIKNAFDHRPLLGRTSVKGAALPHTSAKRPGLIINEPEVHFNNKFYKLRPFSKWCLFIKLMINLIKIDCLKGEEGFDQPKEVSDFQNFSNKCQKKNFNFWLFSKNLDFVQNRAPRYPI